MSQSDKLPHWASVALVARCARLVLPSFDHAWPEAPLSRRGGLLAAIFFGEQSAAKAMLSDGYPEADSAATEACGALRLYVLACRGEAHGMTYDKSEGFPTDIAQAELAAHSAAVAAKITETVGAEPEQSYQFAVDGVNWAIEVARENPELMDELHDEFDGIHLAASKGKWTHETPVIWKTSGWWKVT